MAKQQLTRMHAYYGRNPFHRCRDCCNLERYEYHGKTYRKCIRYGLSNSEATDWALSYEACGAFNKPLRDNEIPLCEVRNKRINDNEPLDGQMGM